jgi:hypothetical protein
MTPENGSRILELCEEATLARLGPKYSTRNITAELWSRFEARSNLTGLQFAILYAALFLGGIGVNSPFLINAIINLLAGLTLYADSLVCDPGSGPNGPNCPAGPR